MYSVSRKTVSVFVVLALLLPAALLNGAFLASADPAGGASGTGAGSSGAPHPNLAFYANWDLDKDKNGIADTLDADLASGLTGPVLLHLHYGRRPTETDASLLKAEFGASRTYVFRNWDDIKVETTFEKVRGFLEAPGVVAVERFVPPVMHMDVSTKVVRVNAAPGLPVFGGIDHGLAVADTLGFRGEGMVIAVLDTGVDDTHEALDDLDDDPNTNDPKQLQKIDPVTGAPIFAAADASDGFVIRECVNVLDDMFHGTHVAGTALGTGGPSGKYPGVAPKARLVDIDINTPFASPWGFGLGLGQDIAMDWIISFNKGETCYGDPGEDRIDVATMSFGAGGASSTTSQSLSITAVARAGITFTVSAGNSGDGASTLTVGADGGIIVANHDDFNTILRNDDKIAASSSRGPRPSDGDADTLDELRPDIAAPGQNIMAPLFHSMDQYWSLSGTSMAAPHVAGVAALMLQANPNLRPVDKGDSKKMGEVGAVPIRDIIQKTAQYKTAAASAPPQQTATGKFGLPWNNAWGYGALDGYAAVKMALDLGAGSLSVEAGGPYVGVPDTPTILTAVASGGTPPYSYSWTLGDGATATGASVSHTYAAGTYTATVQVTDSAVPPRTAFDTATVVSGGSLPFRITAPTAGSAIAGGLFTIEGVHTVGRGVGSGGVAFADPQGDQTLTFVVATPAPVPLAFVDIVNGSMREDGNDFLFTIEVDDLNPEAQANAYGNYYFNFNGRPTACAVQGVAGSMSAYYVNGRYINSMEAPDTFTVRGAYGGTCVVNDVGTRQTLGSITSSVDTTADTITLRAPKDHFDGITPFAPGDTINGLEVLAQGCLCAPANSGVGGLTPTYDTATTTDVLVIGGGPTTTGTVEVSIDDPAFGASAQLAVNLDVTARTWQADWDLTGLVGAHRIYARQLDSSGGLVAAHDVGVTVNGGTGPFVRIDTPANGQTVSGTIPVSGVAGSGTPPPPPENQIPSASLVPSATSGNAPLAVTFVVDGTDADGTLVAWDLDFGDGSPHAGASGAPAGAAVPYTYTTPGLYNARLCVTDNVGGMGCVTVPIDVTNVLPPSVVTTLYLRGDTMVGQADRISDSLTLGVGSLRLTEAAPAATSVPDAWTSAQIVGNNGRTSVYDNFWEYRNPVELHNAYITVSFFGGRMGGTLEGSFRIMLFADGETTAFATAEARAALASATLTPSEHQVTLGPLTKSIAEKLVLNIDGIGTDTEANYIILYDSPEYGSRLTIREGSPGAILPFAAQAYNAGLLNTQVYAAGNQIQAGARFVEVGDPSAYRVDLSIIDPAGNVVFSDFGLSLEGSTEKYAYGAMHTITDGMPNGAWKVRATVYGEGQSTTRERTIHVRGTPASASGPAFGGLESARGLDGAAVLAWKPAETSVPGPVTYEIYMGLAGGNAFANKIGETTSATFTAKGLANGRDYLFGVRARDASGAIDGNTVGIPATPRSGGAGGERVEVSVNGNVQVATGTNSWSLSVDTTTFADGPATIEARYFDGTAWSAPASIGVTIANGAPPQVPKVTIGSPADGSKVSGTVPVSGTTGRGAPPTDNNPPTAALSASRTSGTAPLATVFTVGGADVDGDALTFTLVFGDGSSTALTGPADVPHTYSAAGTYLALLTVSDGRGGVATASVEIRVSNVGDVLELSANGPYFGKATDGVTLLATATGGVSPYVFEWDLDNDGSFETTQGASGVHFVRPAGNHALAVRVTDAASTTKTAATSAYLWAQTVIPITGDDVAGAPFGLVGSPTGLFGLNVMGWLEMKLATEGAGPNAHTFEVPVSEDASRLEATITWGHYGEKITVPGLGDVIVLNDYDLLWETPSGEFRFGDAGTGTSSFGASAERPETSIIFDPAPGTWKLHVQPFALSRPDTFTGAITIDHADDPRTKLDVGPGFLAQNGVANTLTANAKGAFGPFTYEWTLPNGAVATGQSVSFTPNVPSGSGPGELGSLKHSFVRLDATLKVTDSAGGSDTEIVPIYVRNIPRDAEVVIATIDTGILPYHDDFAEDGLALHPSLYLQGYPKDAPALNLCLDETRSACSTVKKARATDAATIAAVQDGQLYWIPGTKFVGAISFGSEEGPNRILDDHSHGTGVSSASAGNIWGSCPGCKIVGVEIDLGSDSLERAIGWTAQQPWIDVVSISIGSLANIGAPGVYEIDQLTREAVRNGKVVAIAAGNGALPYSGVDFGGGLVVSFPHGVPTFESNYVGPGWVVVVGAISPVNGQDYIWHDYPVDVGSYGDKWRTSYATNPADPGSNMQWTGEFGGTSCATPVVAGAMGAVLLEARRAVGDLGVGGRRTADGQQGLVIAPAGATLPATGPLANGVLTRMELETAVFRTAIPGDTLSTDPNRYTVFLTADNTIPNHPAYFVREGYGLVNQVTAVGVSTRPAAYPAGVPTNQPAHGGTTALDVVLGLKPEPNRAVIDAWHTSVDAVRNTFWKPNPTTPGFSDTDNDAWPKAVSGTATPGSADTTVPVPDLAVTRATTGAQPSSKGAVLYLHNTAADGFFMNTLATVDGERSGQGSTGVEATSTFVFPMKHPALASTLALDTSEKTYVVLTLTTYGAVAPFYPSHPITATLEGANGKVVATGTVTRNLGGNLAGAQYVFELATQVASFDPAVDGDLQLRVSSTFPASLKSWHFTTNGASYVALPVTGGPTLSFPSSAPTSLYLHKARGAANSCTTGVVRWASTTASDDTGTGCGYNAAGSVFANVDAVTGATTGASQPSVVDRFTAETGHVAYPLKVLPGTATARLFVASQTGNQLTLSVGVYAGAELLGKGTGTVLVNPGNVYQEVTFPVEITKAGVVNGHDRRLTVQVWPESGSGDWFYSHSGGAKSRLDGLVLAPGIEGAAAPVVTVTVTPSSGTVPLATTIRVVVTDADSASLASLSLDIGDGSPPLGFTDVALPYDQTFLRTFAAVGTFPIVVNVFDDSGLPGSASTSVTALPVATVQGQTFYLHNTGPTSACGSGVKTSDRVDRPDGGHGCGYNALGSVAVTGQAILGQPVPLFGSILDSYPFAETGAITIGPGAVTGTIYVTSDTGNNLALEVSMWKGSTKLAQATTSRQIDALSDYVPLAFAMSLPEAVAIDPSDPSTNLVFQIRPTQSTGDWFYGYNAPFASSAVVPVQVTVVPPDLPPLASLVADKLAIVRGEFVEFLVDGSDDKGIASWSLDLGDGTTVSSDGPVSLPQAILHQYNAIGPMTAVLTVTDTIGQTATDDVMITVSTPPDAEPSATLVGPATGDAGREVVFSLTAEDDVGIASWSLAFGDGTRASGTGAPPATVPHTYARPGPYSAVFLVTDTVGQSASDSVSVAMRGVEVSLGSGGARLATDTSTAGDWSSWTVDLDSAGEHGLVAIVARYFDGAEAATDSITVNVDNVVSQAVVTIGTPADGSMVHGQVPARGTAAIAASQSGGGSATPTSNAATLFISTQGTSNLLAGDPNGAASEEGNLWAPYNTVSSQGQVPAAARNQLLNAMRASLASWHTTTTGPHVAGANHYYVGNDLRGTYDPLQRSNLQYPATGTIGVPASINVGGSARDVTGVFVQFHLRGEGEGIDNGDGTIDVYDCLDVQWRTGSSGAWQSALDPGTGVNACTPAKIWSEVAAWELRSVQIPVAPGAATTIQLRLRFVSDSYFEREGYHIDDVKVIATYDDAKPTVSDLALTPTSADTSTPVSVAVNYCHTVGAAPDRIEAIVDEGTAAERRVPLTLVRSGSLVCPDTAGYGGALPTLAVGDHAVLVEAEAAGLVHRTAPATLTIVNTPPTLSGAAFSPTSPTTSDDVTFRIVYTDADGHVPATLRIRLDGEPYAMVAGVGDVTAGVEYTYTTKLALGSHTWKVEANDGFSAVATDTMSGPTVFAGTAQPPVLSQGGVTPESAPAGTTFTYTVRYSDVNGDAPASVEVVIDGIPTAMTCAAGDLFSGVDCTYSTATLAAGLHTYYFRGEDATTQKARVPSSGVVAGPEVTDFVSLVQVRLNGGAWQDATAAGQSGGFDAWSYALDADALPRGRNVFEARAADSAGAFGPIAQSNIIVNAPPTAALAASPTSTLTLSAVTFDASGSTDDDIANAMYRFDFGDGSPVVVQASPVAQHAYAKGTNAGRTYTASVVVIDSDGVESSPATASVIVHNRAPSLARIDDHPAKEHVLLTVVATASDPEGDPLTFSGDLPTGATLTPNGDGTATFAWRPSGTQAGSHLVTIRVTDGEDTASRTFLVDVADNIAPTLVPIGARSGVEQVLVRIDVSASDAEGDALTLTANPLPSGASFVDAGDGTGVFTWTPSRTQADTYYVKFRVFDGEYAAEETVTLTIADNNIRPGASFTITPASGTKLTTFTATDTSVDTDGSIASRSWSVRLVQDPTPDGVADTPGVYLTGSGPVYSFSVPDDGIWEIELVATDNEGLTATTVRTITAANIAPTVSNVGPGWARPGTPAAFADQSTDKDGTIVLREWDMDGDGVYEIVNPGTSFFHTFETAGTKVVWHRVTDDDGASSKQSLLVLVDGTAPVTTATAPAAAEGGWYPTASVDVRIARTDSGSGVITTTVVLDGATTVRGGSNDFVVTVSGNGVHTLTYYSTDRVGNVEASKTMQIRIDTTAPSVEVTEPSVASSPAPAIGVVLASGGPARLAANAADSLSGIVRVEFFVDGALVASDADGSDGFTGTWDVAGLPTGVYEVRAVATNGAGLRAASSRMVAVVAPLVAQGAIAIHGWNDGSTPAYVVDDGYDAVVVDADANGVRFADSPDMYEILRAVAAAAGYASDGLQGGDLVIAVSGSVSGSSCVVILSVTGTFDTIACGPILAARPGEGPVEVPAVLA